LEAALGSSRTQHVIWARRGRGRWMCCCQTSPWACCIPLSSWAALVQQWVFWVKRRKEVICLGRAGPCGGSSLSPLVKSGGIDAVVLQAVSSLAMSAGMTLTWWEAPGKTQADLPSRSSAERSVDPKNSLTLKFLVIQNLLNLGHKSLISIRSVPGLPGMTLN